MVQKGRYTFRVYHEDDARAVGGIIFPPADGLTGYARARKAAADWEAELRGQTEARQVQAEAPPRTQAE